MAKNAVGKVFLIKTRDRDAGIRSLLSEFDISDYSGKSVALKANLNSSDPFPASTHHDTLKVLVEIINEARVRDLTLVERSGMGDTREVLKQLGVFELSEKLGFKVVVLNETDKELWAKIDKNGTHWSNGFYLSKAVLDTDKVVQTCCLKTHRFGGHFTLSLKNSVGLVARKVPELAHDFMQELHESPYQRDMIAEINKFYDVDLVVMDAIEAFVRGGPESGEVVKPDLLLASRDRIAIDAVGIAILRSYGSTKNVINDRIFSLDQIRRAAELEIGVKSESDLELIPLTDESKTAADGIKDFLSSQ